MRGSACVAGWEPGGATLSATRYPHSAQCVRACKKANDPHGRQASVSPHYGNSGAVVPNFRTTVQTVKGSEYQTKRKRIV